MLRNRVIKAAKEISWITCGQLLVIFGGLFGVSLLTDFLTPSQYGALSLGSSLGLLINSVFLVPISNGSIRFFSAAKSEDNIANYFRALFNIILKIFALTFIFYFLLIRILSYLGYQAWLNLALASLLFGCFLGLNNIFNNIQNASRNRSVVAIHKGLMTFFRFFFAILLIKFLGNTTKNAMYGQALGMFFVLISQTFFLKKLVEKSVIGTVQRKITSAWESKILSYSWPFSTWGLLNWFVNSIDRWALLFFSSPETVGLYVVIYQIGYHPISIIIGLLTNYIEPIYYQKVGNFEDSNKLKSTYRFAMKLNFTFIIFLLFIVLIGFYFHEIIFSIFLDQRYRSVSYLLGPMMLVSILDGNTRILSILIQTKKETKSLILPNCITSLSGIIFTLIGAYFFELRGILIAFILNAIFKLIWFYSLTRNKYMNLELKS